MQVNSKLKQIKRIGNILFKLKQGNNVLKQQKNYIFHKKVLALSVIVISVKEDKELHREE